MCAKLLPALCDPMDEVHQASLPIDFSRQEYWSELPCSPPGDLPDPHLLIVNGRAMRSTQVYL